MSPRTKGNEKNKQKDGLFCMEQKTYQLLCSKFNHFHIEIVEHGLYKADRTWNFKQITSPFNRLYFVLSGDGYLENSHRRILLTPGFVYLIPAGSVYDYGCENLIYKFFLHFNLELFPGADVFDGLGQCLSRPCSLEFIKSLLALLDSESYSDLLRFQSMLGQVVSDFLDSAQSDYGICYPSSAFGKYASLLSQLNHNLSSATRLSDLALHQNLSYQTMLRNFKRDIGIGLKEYQEKLLLKKAKRLLLTTDLNIYEIADQLGFSDPYYFSRFFKKFESLPPREYRKLQLHLKGQS